ncbi:MAG: ATP-binding cassette domain-containing protein [Sedimentisphaerales bacterium]|nr:ATP-binding cassette domain-containing protein [Sedimentisphaerales bacterium]
MELNSVCKSFGQVCAVDNLSVTVPSGCVYGFLGPNGAGKTTTLRMLMNIIRPDSGNIRIFSDGTISKIKHRTGYMPEERGLYRKMTVRETLKYFGAIKEVKKGELAKRIEQWIELIKLSDWADKKVEELSRGMHQKLQFAVTAINAPELLILDEPFSGLDPVNQELMKDIIAKIRAEGKTIILSTHLMHEAETLCDNVLMINHGRAVLDGNLREIKSRYQPNVVSLDVDGDTGFLEQLEFVESIQRRKERLEVRLRENTDPQELLMMLASRVKVRVFEIKQPTLHELFLKLAGQTDE